MGGGAGAQNMYNAAAYPLLDDGQYQGQHLHGFGAGDASGGHHSPNGDAPQSQEQLAAANSSLKTRVAELEVINDFIQRRLGHYEPPYGTAPAGNGQDGQGAEGEAHLRSQVELLTQSETQLRTQLDESHRRENMLKRRLDELEQELHEANDSLTAYESSRAKKPRLESPSAARSDAVTTGVYAPSDARATTSDAAPAGNAPTAAPVDGASSAAKAEDAAEAEDAHIAKDISMLEAAAAATAAVEANAAAAAAARVDDEAQAAQSEAAAPSS